MRKFHAVMALVVLTAIFAIRSFPLGSTVSTLQVSERAAASLRGKIDAIKKADTDKNRKTPLKLEIPETELESYVMVDLKADIPVRVESLHVQLTPGAIAADTRLTIPAGSTGNFFVDALVSGTHNIYVKGKMSAARGEGKFDLQDVRVDGIPVPNFLIEVLVKRYAKPKYPNVDFKEPFDLPWGIDAIEVGQGKAMVTY